MIAHNEATILIFTNETFITFKLLKAPLALSKSKVTLLNVERLYQHCFEHLFTPCLLSVALVLNLVNTKLVSPAFKVVQKIGNKYSGWSHIEDSHVFAINYYHIQPATEYINFILCITFVDYIISLCCIHLGRQVPRIKELHPNCKWIHLHKKNILYIIPILQLSLIHI